MGINAQPGNPLPAENVMTDYPSAVLWVNKL